MIQVLIIILTGLLFGIAILLLYQPSKPHQQFGIITLGHGLVLLMLSTVSTPTYHVDHLNTTVSYIDPFPQYILILYLILLFCWLAHCCLCQNNPNS